MNQILEFKDLIWEILTKYDNGEGRRKLSDEYGDRLTKEIEKARKEGWFEGLADGKKSVG